MRTLCWLAGTALSLGLGTAPVISAGGDVTPQAIAVEVENGAAFKLIGRESWRQLVVTGLYAGGERRDLTRAVRYEVTPPGVVVVDATGLVTPRHEGRTVIQVRGPGGTQAQVQVTVARLTNEPAVHFANQVVPIFTRFGCNAGGCHGRAGGQNGFALSLLGFEPADDFDFIVKEARGRRLLPAAPDQSLLLLKATGRVPHGGGARLDPASAYYRLLRRWVAQGAPRSRLDSATVTRLEVLPGERVLSRSASQQLAVIAHLSDGSTEDVTRLTQFEPNEPTLAEVSPTGLVTAKRLPGAVAIMARFQTHVAVFRALVPLGAPMGKLPPTRNLVDDLVFKQLRRLGIPPSAECDDATFLRRATLDLAGRLPTLTETQQFLADRAPDRHERLVDRLLASDDYATYLAGTWANVLRNRRALPSEDTAPTAAFHTWIKDHLKKNTPFDQFARALLTATGEEVKTPPVVWYRELREPSAQVEDVAQLFLGQRLACAKCHHHPFERWTQDDYWGLSAFFARVEVKLPTTAKKKGKNKAVREPARVAHRPGIAQAVNPRTGQALKPRGLGGAVLEIAPDADPRARLADWLTAADNPFFAQALANRTWKHFFGRGLVEPEDDLRITNPPSNPELLDALARFVVASKFDVKKLTRLLCTSTAYRLSAVPNAHNADDRQNFSHFGLRRLHAEVLLDAVDVVTGSTTRFAGLPEGTRAVQLPDNQFPSYFLSVFGRPDAASACECERGSDSTLAQSLYLFNSEELREKIRGRTQPAAEVKSKKKNPPKKTSTPAVVNGTVGGRLRQLLKDSRPDREKVRELYLIALSRVPTSEELAVATDYLEARRDDPASAYEDIIWALLNTKEFQFNH